MSHSSALTSLHTVPSQEHGPKPPGARIPSAPIGSRSLPLRYGVALLSATVAVGVRELLTPLLGSQLPFLTLFPAVMVSAWYGGLGPGLLTTALGALAAAYFWLAPFYSLTVARSADVVGLALAVLEMLLIAWLAAALRRAQEQLEHRVQERTAELAQANAASASERARLTTVLEQLPVGVIIANAPSGDTLVVNAQAKQIWRYETFPSAFAPETVRYQAFFADGRPYQIEDWPLQHTLRTGAVTPEEEITFIRGDGTRGVMQASAAPIREADGRFTTAVVTIMDVTARKEMEEALRASEEQFRNAFESAATGMALVDMDGHWRQVNAALCAMFGYTAEELRSLTFQALTHPADLEADLDLARQVVSGEIPSYHLEKRYYHKQGTVVWGLLSVAVVHDADRQPRYFISQIQDITARKQMEQELRTLNAELDQRVQERTAALQESEAKLAAELADMTQLQQVSSHLLQEGNLTALYEQILEAAMTVMRTEMGSIQMFHPDTNHLRLLAWRGFAPASAEFWREVRVDSGSTCGVALATGARVIAPDVETCEFMAGTANLDFYRLSGVRAVQSTPLVSRGGRVVGMISTHWRTVHQPSERELRLLDVLARQAADLIERKAAEDQLRESEERFRVAQELALDGFVLLRPVPDAQGAISDFVCVYANPAAARMLRQPAERLIGQQLLPLFPNYQHTEVFDAYVRASESGRAQDLELHYRADGVEGWFRHAVVKAGEYVAVSFYDITARKQAEEALRESEARFRLLANSAPVLIWVNDLHGCEFVNREYLRFLGVSAGEVRGYDWTPFLHPEDREAYVTAYLDAMARRRPFVAQFRFRRHDGVYRWMHSVALPRFGGQEECLGYVGSTTDITDLKEAEETLAQHARDLERLNADLRQVAYIFAHDLQEPVRQMGVYTQKLAKHYRDAIDAETTEAMDFIIEGAKRMRAQFTDLIHYLDVDEQGPSRSPTDCEDTLRLALQALHDPLTASGAMITHDPLPTLDANAAQLQLVLQELLDNALKFRNSTPPRVHMWAEREARGWRFAVRDNGIGVDPQGSGQLFGFFKRLHPRQQYPGTGMGLAICKKIVERHGGRIWVESAPGAGSTFLFTIADKGSQ